MAFDLNNMTLGFQFDGFHVDMLKWVHRNLRVSQMPPFHMSHYFVPIGAIVSLAKDQGLDFTAEDIVRLASKASLAKSTHPLLQVLFLYIEGSPRAWVRATPAPTLTKFMIDSKGTSLPMA